MSILFVVQENCTDTIFPEFEVEVVVRRKSAARSFPPGYFDLIGSVDDETLIVYPQPPLPPPVEIE